MAEMSTPSAVNPWQTFVLPLAPNVQATLSVAWPMTPAQWDRLMIVLDAMRPGLVHDGLTATEAQATEAGDDALSR